jgi:phosphosulfolactate phosphohydrolase-like enzyme
MGGGRTFKIDAFPGSAFRHLERDAIVCIDVICASTTVVTAVSVGRRVIPAAGPDVARRLAPTLPNAVVALDGPWPRRRRSEVAASPVALSRREDVERPLVIVGMGGTELMVNSAGARAAYVACFRNMAATAAQLAAQHRRVALIGAGAMGDFRCEDQMATARIGLALMEAGFACEDPATASLVDRWADVDLHITTWGKSAAELKAAGRGEDLEFILAHVDDLDLVCGYRDGVIAALPRRTEPRGPRRPRALLLPSGGAEAAAAAPPLSTVH